MCLDNFYHLKNTKFLSSTNQLNNDKVIVSLQNDMKELKNTLTEIKEATLSPSN